MITVFWNVMPRTLVPTYQIIWCVIPAHSNINLVLYILHKVLHVIRIYIWRAISLKKISKGLAET
jgi:hypothetical protein